MSTRLYLSIKTRLGSWDSTRRERRTKHCLNPGNLPMIHIFTIRSSCTTLHGVVSQKYASFSHFVNSWKIAHVRSCWKWKEVEWKAAVSSCIEQTVPIGWSQMFALYKFSIRHRGVRNPVRGSGVVSGSRRREICSQKQFGMFTSFPIYESSCYKIADFYLC